MAAAQRASNLAIRTRGIISSAIQQVYSALWGGAGVGPRETFAGQWQSSSRDMTGTMTSKSPLSHSAVYTCINNIASDISKLTLRVMRPRSTGGFEPHFNHPVFRVLNKPNHYQTSLQFLLQYIGSKMWTGNAYVILFRDARGVVESMHVLDPTTVTPAITTDGSVWYMVKANNLNNLSEDTYIPARDILHDRAITLFHPLIGVSPLFAAAVSAMTGNSISANSELFFSNMSRASGTLTAPGEIPQSTADRLKKEWDGNYAGLGFGKVAVLGAGITWTPLTMTAVDAQLIEQLRWTVEDIGRVYRVPGFMLGETKMTYKNSEQLSRYYFSNCLSHHIESLEQCFDQKFEMKDGNEIKFDLSPLFRMETDLRYETHTKALTSGIKSINEVRAEEDLPPVKGGEEPRLQMQYIPLSMIDLALSANTSNAPKKPAADPGNMPADPGDMPAEPTPPADPAPASPAGGKAMEEAAEEAAEEFIEAVRARVLAVMTAGA